MLESESFIVSDQPSILLETWSCLHCYKDMWFNVSHVSLYCKWCQLSYSKVKWIGSQSNRGAWTVTFLSKKSCTLNNVYSFGLSGKRLILTIGIRAKVTSWHQLSRDESQVDRVTIESGCFWPSGKRSILTVGIRTKITSSVPGGQLLRGGCCGLHNCPVTKTGWTKSQSKGEILSRTIAEGEIVVGGINCFVAETTSVESQSNHYTL